jgi:DNA-binding NtrC family response regulator
MSDPVYVVDDDASVRESLENLIRSAGLSVETFASAQEFLACPRPDAPSCLVLDVQLPGLSGLDLQRELAKADVQLPIVFLTGHGDIPMSVRAIKAGAVEFLTKPFHDEELLDAIQQGIARDREARQQRTNLAQQEVEGILGSHAVLAALAAKEVCLEEEVPSEHDFESIIGQDTALRHVLTLVETVAPTGSTVLIRGETGTGKELIARAIHDRSDRSERSFVKLNCAAIPSGLLESELFGHERGAFTGAIASRVGRFELAHGGTLFLDEVGDIPTELQPKLLRVLQEQEFERLGSARTIRADVRLVAATNRDLEEMVEAGSFRRDLYYRLDVFPITLPPLRERRGDIPDLVQHFTKRLARRMNKRIETIPADAMVALRGYEWPGNVRELENVIERAVILTSGPVLQVPLSHLGAQSTELPAPSPPPSLQGTLEATQRAAILRALEEASWVISGADGAAARLGLNRTTLQSRMRKLGIERPRA